MFDGEPIDLLVLSRLHLLSSPTVGSASSGELVDHFTIPIPVLKYRPNQAGSSYVLVLQWPVSTPTPAGPKKQLFEALPPDLPTSGGNESPKQRLKNLLLGHICLD